MLYKTITPYETEPFGWRSVHYNVPTNKVYCYPLGIHWVAMFFYWLWNKTFHKPAFFDGLMISEITSKEAPPLTSRQAQIISAYTGYLCCSFKEFHDYVEEKLCRDVWTHEMSNIKIQDEIQEKSRKDFLSLCNSFIK